MGPFRVYRALYTHTLGGKIQTALHNNRKHFISHVRTATYGGNSKKKKLLGRSIRTSAMAPVCVPIHTHRSPASLYWFQHETSVRRRWAVAQTLGNLSAVHSCVRIVSYLRKGNSISTSPRVFRFDQLYSKHRAKKQSCSIQLGTLEQYGSNTQVYGTLLGVLE